VKKYTKLRFSKPRPLVVRLIKRLPSKLLEQQEREQRPQEPEPPQKDKK